MSRGFISQQEGRQPLASGWVNSVTFHSFPVANKNAVCKFVILYSFLDKETICNLLHKLETTYLKYINRVCSEIGVIASARTGDGNSVQKFKRIRCVIVITCKVFSDCT